MASGTNHTQSPNIIQLDPLYQTVFDNTSVAMAILNPDGTIMKVNNAACEFLGYSSDELIQMNVDAFTLPDDLDASRRAIEDVTEHAKSYSIEKRYLRKDGRVVWGREHLSGVYDENNKLELISVICEDITDLKNRDRALKESEHRFQLFMDHLPAAAYIKDEDNRIVFANKFLASVIHKTADELIGRVIDTELPEELADSFRKENANVLRENKSYDFEHVFPTSEGETFWLTRKFPIGDGRSNRYLGVISLDITQRKAMQLELQKSIKMYAALFDKARNPIMIMDVNEQYVDANPAALRFLECDLQSLKSKLIWDFSPPHLKRQQKRQLRPMTHERTIETAYLVNGRIKTLMLSVVPLQLEDSHLLVGIGHDITQQKEQQLALQESHYQMLETLNSISDGFFALDDNLTITYFNAAAEKILGKKMQQVVGSPLFDVFPEARDTVFETKYCKAIKEKKALTFETFFQTQPYRNWYDVHVYPKTNGISVYFQVTTEQKIAERKLHEGESRFRALYESTSFGIILLAKDGSLIAVNPTLEQILGYSEEELLDKDLSQVTYPDDLSRDALKFEGLVSGRDNAYDLEKRFIKKDGTIIHAMLKVSRVENVANVGPLFAVGIVEDITKRKKAEEALRASEEKFKSLFNDALDIIAIISPQLTIIDINPAATQQLGYAKSEIIGRSVDDFIDASVLEKQELRDTLLNGKDVRNANTTLMKKNGDPVIVEFSAVPEKVGNQIVSIRATVRDITERQKAQDELVAARDQLRNFSSYLQKTLEDERAHISREIHDELGQSLTALKIDLSWLKKRNTNDPEIRTPKLQSMTSLLDSTIHTVKRLSSELRPGLLDDLGLIPAMQWLLDDFQKRTDIECKLELGVEELELDRERSTALYRIFQESLTNVARHAGAEHVNASISIQQEKVVLQIKDDGIGMQLDTIDENKSLGLVGMRERLLPFGGELEIQSAPQQGTSIHVLVPMETDV